MKIRFPSGLTFISILFAIVLTACPSSSGGEGRLSKN